MPSQRNISKHQAIDIELADDSGIAPKAAHEFLGRYVGGSSNLGYTHRDHKNYLCTKHQREMLYGEAGSLSLQSELLEGNRQLKKSAGLLSTQLIRLSYVVVDSLRGLAYYVGMH